MSQSEQQQTPESALLRLCSRGIAPEADALRELLQRDVDWDWILGRADRHKVSPLLHYYLRSEANGLVPATVRQRLEQRYQTVLLANSLLYQELDKLIAAFSCEAIPVIVLKGAALGLNTYPSAALRPFSDLDILIHRDDLDAAKQMMAELGYSLILDSYRLPNEKNEELGCEWSYHKGGVVVEVHWQLLDSLAPYSVQIEDFWNDASEMAIGKQSAIAMSPENQLLHLCLHASYKHQWDCLRDLTDICFLIEKNESSLNWESIIEASDRHSITRCTYYSLLLSRNVLGAKVPDEPLKVLSGNAGAGWPGAVLSAFIADNILADRLPRRIWKLLVVNSYRDRAHEVKDMAARPFGLEDEQQARSKLQEKKLRSIVKSAMANRHLPWRILRSVLRHRRSF